MGTKRATMRDVAAASGVSPATVSFVLNGASGQTISASTRERVEQAARDLSYVPHAIAKALREGSSRIVVLDLDPLFRGTSAESYIAGLDAELALNGYVLLVRHGGGDAAAMTAVADSIRPRAVISLAGLYTPERDDSDDGGWVDGLAAHSAVQVQHLVDSGHTSIAVALPDDPKWERLAQARLRFAREHALHLGLPEPVELSAPLELGELVTRVGELLRQHPSITAIATFDDGVALRLLRALRSLDVAVPDRVAVMGFDDSEFGTLSVPTLTTVHIDAESFGRIAARRALGLGIDDIAASGARVIARESA